ncbi:MAG: tetratricopeptide repeat protein, partial [Elusimicrobia bacterium]|nr:tetratricopeptide repeat protein [Elusimicrobiota bacterium]
HHTLLLVFPAFLYEIWRRRPAAAPWLRAAFFFAAFFLAGLCVYLVLPLRSLHVPPLDWGHPADWSGFWKVLLRRDYGSLALTTSGHAAGGWAWLRQIARVFLAVWREVGWPGILLGAGGFWVWTRRSSAAAPPALPGTRSSAQSAAPSWGFGLAFLFFTGPFFLLLGNPPFTTELDGVLPRFYLLPVLWFALCAGWSVDELELRLGRWSWCALLIPLLLLGQRRAAWALREDFMAYDYGRALLKSMAPGSALFMDGGDDAFYTLAFLHYAEGMRPDLELHDRGALIYRNVYGPDFRQLSKDDKEKRRLEVESRYAARTSVYYSTLRDEVLPGAVLLPSGVAQRSIWQKDAPDRAAALRRESAWPFYVFRVNAALVERHYRDRALAPFFWFGRGQELAALGQWREALRQWRFARSIGPDIDWLGSSLSRAMEWLAYRLAQSGDWGGAEEVYRDNLAFEPAKSQLWENLAVTLEKREKFDEAVSAYRKALAASPKSVNAYMGLGVVYWKSADWPKAAEAYSKALEIDPGQAQARAYLRTIEGKLKSR